MKNKGLSVVVLGLFAFLLSSLSAAQTPVGTAFTYQGQLTKNGVPLNDTADFKFTLWDAATGGNPIGATLNVPGQDVVGGLLTVVLDFGAQAFNGEARWLEIAARSPAGGGSYTTLSPRQEVTPTPYAAYALTAGTAVGGITGGGTAERIAKFVDAGRIGDSVIYEAGGKVGIGTTAPSSPLTVAGPIEALAGGFKFPDGSVQSTAVTASPWQVLGNDIFYTAGNVGIGTTTPASPLTVAGQIETTAGGLKFPDGTVQSSAATGGAAGGRNPLQIALLRWYEANEANNTVSVGNSPWGMAFDGASIWVANFVGHSVTKLRASDGLLEGTFSINGSPAGLAFDGANIWVANYSGDSVTKLRASDGTILGTFFVGPYPAFVAFDGASVWVSISNSGSVTKLRASDGAFLGTFNVGMGPRCAAFDGANIWVANSDSNNVSKLRASDGALQGTYNVGKWPAGVVFDGANVWVTNYGDNSVTKLRASDGAPLGTYAVGTEPYPAAFDGTNIWVTNSGSNNVTKLRASDGALLGTYNVGTKPYGVAFDGANIWVANGGSNNVSKL